MSFADRVYFFIQKIPSGRVTTYGLVAKRLGNFNLSRAVGLALKQNKRSFLASVKNCIPCNRVVCADGRLGGFNGGVSQKRLLLLREGVVVKKGRVDLKKYLFKF